MLTEKKEDVNRMQHLIANYKIDTTTEDNFLTDGWNFSDPYFGLSGITGFNGTRGKEITYYIGISTFDRTQYDEKLGEGASLELIKRDVGFKKQFYESTGAEALPGNLAVNAYTLFFKNGVLASIEALLKDKSTPAFISKESGQVFLLENGKQQGVIVTGTGLQYSIITNGSGIEHPTANDKVNIHYHGTHIDGRVFDSSVERGHPITFNVNGVIKGWEEGLQLMKVGDKYKFYIPSELAYGKSGAGKTIAPDEVLVFEIELLEIVNK
jgi:FKBP-type peptidyl-prolyl cis-trans isomerase